MLQVCIVGPVQRVEAFMRQGNLLHEIFRRSSFNCLESTGDGALDIASTAAAVFGKAITSRIDDSFARIAVMRSSPRAIPPCGGVPYSSASRKKPKRSFASSGL